MDTNATLSFMSYNSTGWSDHKAETLNMFLSSLDVSFCAIQEHMQLMENIYRIDSKLNNYISFSIPAHKRRDIISRARPSGGLSFLIKKGLEHYVNHIIVPNSNRVHALTIKLPNANLVIINCYFPTDPQCNNFDEGNLFETLEDIRFVLNSCDFNFIPILCGDFNCDFSRNSRFVNIVSDFMTEYNFKSVWTSFDCDFTYCQASTRNNQVTYSYSTIDHFFLNEHFIDQCENAAVLHLGENLSNHDAIFLKLNSEKLKIIKSDQKSPYQSKPNWLKASPEQINLMTDKFREGVQDIAIPNEVFDCRNLHCTHEDHISEMDTYILQVLSCLDECVFQYIPQTSNHQGNIAGWNDYLKPLKDKVNFWHAIWVSAGRPVNCQLHLIYKKLRNRYHLEVKRLKRYQQAIKNDKFITAATSGNVNNLLDTLKRHRKGKSGLPNTIDNVQGDKNVSEYFQNLYKTIYNHHTYNVSLKEQLKSINEKINHIDGFWIDKITPSLVSKLILKLNSNKQDEFFKFTSNALKLTADTLAEPLSKIFRAYLIHGHFTKDFLLCSLIPIIKDKKKSANHSNNYRLIAISSLILKLMDLLILELLGDKLNVSTLQFGFQPGSSTTMCTWTLTESINYFSNRGTPLYLCFLDLTKAFDHLRLDLLFNKLQNRLPYIFVRLIMYTYIAQRCYVSWGSTKSSTFTIGNGVRQGAVASPILFNIYVDELFSILKASKIGCSIDNYFYGAVGYADDITLLCPTREGLQQLVNIVRNFCDSHGITISTDPNPQKSKTKCIIFNHKHPAKNIKLYNRDIPYVDQWEHLGHIIHADRSTSHDILRSRAVFISKIHSLHQELGKVHPKVFLSLVQVYLCNFYGATTWDLESTEANKLYSTYNMMIRNAYELPYGTHRYILKEVSFRQPLKQSFYNRFIKFSEQLVKCNRPEVVHLFHRQKFDSLSVFGRNYKNIIVLRKRIPKAYDTPVEDIWKLSLIKEILEIKHGNIELEHDDYDDGEYFTVDMLDVMLTQICT